jgi:hypothetical protein
MDSNNSSILISKLKLNSFTFNGHEKTHVNLFFSYPCLWARKKKRSVVVNKMEIVIKKVNMKRDFFKKNKKNEGVKSLKMK